MKTVIEWLAYAAIVGGLGVAIAAGVKKAPKVTAAAVIVCVLGVIIVAVKMTFF